MSNLLKVLRGQPVSMCMNVHMPDREPIPSKPDRDGEGNVVPRSTARDSIQRRRSNVGRRQTRHHVIFVKQFVSEEV